MFQSLNRAYKRSDAAGSRRGLRSRRVSIPQSGLQAFRRAATVAPSSTALVFQSLNRAYKRSDLACQTSTGGHYCCFNPSIGLTSVPTETARLFGVHPGSFNPSIGLTSVPTSMGLGSLPHRRVCFNPSIGLTSVPTLLYWRARLLRRIVSIPQSGLQAFRPFPSRQLPTALCSFNPSIGLTSVPTALPIV